MPATAWRSSSEGDLVSKPYKPMTASVMRAFGSMSSSTRPAGSRFAVAPGQRYTGRAYHIEPDASNASYFFAAAAVTGGRVRVEVSAPAPPRAICNSCGAGSHGRQGHHCRRLHRGHRSSDGALRGFDLDLNAISDTRKPGRHCAVRVRADHHSRVGHARLKETDRVAALATDCANSASRSKNARTG